ncbi:hypothetical protein [Bacillus sp. FJAT-28004]|uniref:hypothetical protein n=1 Tax=Bacillus sp. FJAT-28004 TaxID=1679165 RepID=UPI0006B40B19|nr:hypothetical protein [Bacillus sp. FJAT-28004]
MKRIMITLIAMCFIVTGCFANQTEKEPVIVKDKEKPVTVNENKKSKLTLDKVKIAIEAEGIEMFVKEVQYDWVLNKVKPNRFSVNHPTEKAVYPEFISIYVFESEQARKDGLKDFNIQKEAKDMQIPTIYELKNVLILYWHRYENLDKAKNTKFGKQIEMAIQKI